VSVNGVVSSGSLFLILFYYGSVLCHFLNIGEGIKASRPLHLTAVGVTIPLPLSLRS